MLNHQKMVLQKVMHDEVLFEKELTKSIKWLESEDVQELQNWLRTNFWESHKNVIQRVFDKEAA